MSNHKFTVILLPHVEGEGYQVFFPHYPDCMTSGDTVEEAMEKAKEAIVLHLEGLADEGLDLNLWLAHSPHVVVGEVHAEIPRNLLDLAEAEEAYLRGARV